MPNEPMAPKVNDGDYCAVVGGTHSGKSGVVERWRYTFRKVGVVEDRKISRPAM